MNTTQNTSSQAATSRFGSLRNLGRGIAVSSAVAVMGIGTLSAADASAAGVATGVRHASTVTSTTNAATSLELDRRAAYVIRNGKIVAS